MSPLLIVGGGLFGSLAARWGAASSGLDALVFDPGLIGAASHAAAGLFHEKWAGRKLAAHFHRAIPLLDKLFGIGQVALTASDGAIEKFMFVPPRRVLEQTPIAQRVTAVGDGWLETSDHRYEGWVYVAAGVWCEQFLPGLGVHGRAGTAFSFPGERPGRITPLTHSCQAISFVRDPGSTYFSDGTAERDYTPEHERLTLRHAAEMGLVEPRERYWGLRPYVPGGLVFRRLGTRLWLATGGRKMGTILGASCARTLIDEIMTGA